jgi:hypothetical protein
MRWRLGVLEHATNVSFLQCKVEAQVVHGSAMIINGSQLQSF